MDWFFLIVGAICLFFILIGPIVLLGTGKRFRKLKDKYTQCTLESGVTGDDLINYCDNTKKFTQNIQLISAPEYIENAYSPQTKTIILNESVLTTSSIYSSAVTLHEVGHCLMDLKGKRIVKFWYFLAVIDNIICKLVLPFLIAGLIMRFIPGTWGIIGLVLMRLSTVITLISIFFRIITIKNEESASYMAVEIMKECNGFTKSEISGAQKLLDAAIGTYFVAFYEKIFYNVITVKKIVSNFARRKNV